MTTSASGPAESTREVDVLIVGAGVSGIGAAYRLQKQCPDVTFAIVESRDAIGGTWDLFRYPGVRSDSEMYTFSYPFRPWKGSTSLAQGEDIRRYVQDTADEAGITPRIHFRTRVQSADWSSERGRWTVTTTQPDGSTGTWTCRFLHLCTGYYSYSRGYQPDFAGLDDFRGTLVHPQFWPQDLDWTGRRVVVIGSGATAVTLVPAMADKAAGVTMLQRSPTYLVALPAVDPLARLAQKLLPARAAHAVNRNRSVAVNQLFYQLCRRRPALARTILRAGVLKFVGDEALVDAHLTPHYQPWDQRLCVIPGGDFLKAVRRGKAEIVTDHIDRFVPEGIRLASGKVLPADVVVSATGLELEAIGGAKGSIDGVPIDLGAKFAYRGMMLDGVPNLSFCVGYTNASWTLRADLVNEYLCRLLQTMRRDGVDVVIPRAPAGMAARPLLDLTSGYVQRGAQFFPKQGDRAPWTVSQNYLTDRPAFRRADVMQDLEQVRLPRLVAEPAA